MPREIDKPHLSGEGDARRLWYSYSISEVGTAIGAGALPLVAVLVLQASAWQVSVLSAVSGIAGALVAMPVGAWVEHRRKRPVLVTADLVRASALISVPLAALFDVLTMPQLYLVGVVHGVGTIVFPAASGAYLKRLVTAERRVFWLGRNEATFWTTQSIGPPAGGVLISALGATVTLVIDAVTYGLSALALARMRTAEPDPPARTPRAESGRWREATAGLRYVLGTPALAPLFWNSQLFGGALMLAGPLMSVFYLRELGLEPWQYGLALGIPCLGGLIGATLASRTLARVGERRLLLTAGVARTLWTGLLPLAQPGPAGFALVLAAEFALLLCAGLFNPTFASWRMAHTDDAVMTRVLTGWSASSRSVQPAFMLLGGAIATTTSIRMVLMFSAVLALGSAFLLPWRDERADRSPPG